MGKIDTLAKLAPGDRALLVRTMFVVVAVRLGLTFTSYKRLTRLFLKDETLRPATRDDLIKVSRFVSMVARRVPYATCLTQALSGRILLAGLGQESTIRIGVAVEPGGSMAAHAWLLSGETVILGGNSNSLRRYTPLADLD